MTGDSVAAPSVPLKFTNVVKVCADKVAAVAAQNKKTMQTIFDRIGLVTIITSDYNCGMDTGSAVSPGMREKYEAERREFRRKSNAEICLGSARFRDP